MPTNDTQTIALASPTDVVDSIYAALQRRDLPHILSLVAPGAVWQGPPTVPWGGKHIGPDGVKRFFGQLGENFELSGVSIKDRIASGDRVVMLGSFAGKGRKTGKTAETDFAWIWEVKDGKVVAYQGLFDTAAIVTALS